MSDRLEWWAHFAGGAGIALVELAIFWRFGPLIIPLRLWAVSSLWNATLIGNVREQEQARRKGAARPSAFWRWGRHRIGEWLAWPAGAATVVAAVGVYALLG